MAAALRSRVLIGLTLVVLLLVAWKFVLGSFLGEWLLPSTSSQSLNDASANLGYRKVELENQRIQMPFLDQLSYRSENWNVAGDVVIENHSFVALTSDKPHQAGSIFNKSPLNAESFEIQLAFNIYGSIKLNADGMAVWLIDGPSPIGDVFGARGDFEGLGIFIDTFRNGPTGHFPYVSAQLGHGSTFYNKYDDGMSTQLAGCTAKSLLNPASGKTIMKLVYLKSGYLSVEFNYDPDNSDNWHKCFTIYDIVLPRTKYLGISAETGQLTQSVEIFSNNVYGLYNANDDTFIESFDQDETSQEEPEEKSANSVSDKKHIRRRKSYHRLKMAEERVRQQDRLRRLELYGDADATFVRRWWKRFVKLVKILMGLALLVFVGWVARLVLKTRSQSRRSRTTGLLD